MKWHIADCQEQDFRIDINDDSGITVAAAICFDATYEKIEERKAARLIAAAPDLLHALEALVDDLVDAGDHLNPETEEVYSSAANAIEVLRVFRNEPGM